jgi:signal peptidase I
MNLTRCIKNLFREWVLPLLFIVAITSPLRSAIVDMNYVPSGSMKPTILVGDNLLVNKLAYDLKVPFTTSHIAKWGDPARGEIVVFYGPEKGVRMVKRVVGVPGDKIQLKNNHLIINGKVLNYVPAISSDLDSEEGRRVVCASEKLGSVEHLVMEQPLIMALRTTKEYVVPAGQYFVMGDNRDNSRDSRFFGFVPRANIVGRAERIIYSKLPWKLCLPRWGRFFKGLI